MGSKMVLTYKRKRSSYSCQVNLEKKGENSSLEFSKDSTLARVTTNFDSAKEQKLMDHNDDKGVATSNWLKSQTTALLGCNKFRRQRSAKQNISLTESEVVDKPLSFKQSSKSISDRRSSFKWKGYLGRKNSSFSEVSDRREENQDAVSLNEFHSVDSNSFCSVKSDSPSNHDPSKRLKDPLLTFRRRAKKEHDDEGMKKNSTSDSHPKYKSAIKDRASCMQIRGGDACETKTDGQSGHMVTDLGKVISTLDVDMASVAINNKQQEQNCHPMHKLNQTRLTLNDNPTSSFHDDLNSNASGEISCTTRKREHLFTSFSNDEGQSILPSILPLSTVVSRTLLRDDAVSDAANPELCVASSRAMNLDLNMLPPDGKNPSNPGCEAFEVEKIKTGGFEQSCPMHPVDIVLPDSCQKKLGEMLPEACGTRPTRTPCLDFLGNDFQQRSNFYKNQSGEVFDMSSSFSQICNFSTSPSLLDIHSDSSTMHLPSNLLSRSCQPQFASGRGVWLLGKHPLSNCIRNRAVMFTGNCDRGSENMKRCTNIWSEEELDCLWIGVRRYGKDNWVAMLQDTNLYFAEGRVAEDLAKQWAQEQLRLLNARMTLHSKFQNTDSNPPKGHGCHDHFTYGIQRSKTETDLSLGHVYTQQGSAIQGRFPLTFMPSLSASHRTREPNLQRLEQSQQRPFSYDIKWQRPQGCLSSIQQKPADRCSVFDHRFSERNLQDALMPTSDKMSCGYMREDELPHWLRDIVNTPRSNESRLPVHASSIVQPINLLYNRSHTLLPIASDLVPINFPKRLRKKQRVGCKTGCLKVRAESATHPAGYADFSWMETQLSLFSSMRSAPLTAASEVFGLRPAAGMKYAPSDHHGSDDPIVIDSNSSSEETISDNQSGNIY